MKTNIIQGGNGHIVGYIDEFGGNRIVRDKQGRVAGKFWKDGNITINLRTGKLVGVGDQTMRLLKD